MGFCQLTSGPVIAASQSKKFSSVTGPAAIPSGGFWTVCIEEYIVKIISPIAKYIRGCQVIDLTFHQLTELQFCWDQLVYLAASVVIISPETFACTRPSASSGLSPPSWSNSRHLKALKQQVLRSGQDGVESQARCSSGHRSCVCGVRSHGPESKADPRCLPPAMRSDWQRNYFNHQLNVKERERGMTRADRATPNPVHAIL